ncbi:ABC transporter substrate-binding protein [Nonomuraea rubra]
MASRRTPRLMALALLPVVLLSAACGGADESPGGTAPDSGARLTMWVRNTAGESAKKLVALYNKSHRNQIKLTVIPAETFQQKVGAAAGARQLPDLLGADVVYSPNYVKQGIFQDITQAATSLPSKDNLSQAHQQVATRDGKIYGLPLLVDSSLMIYNKDLFAKAGLDPDKPPADFDGIYEAAKAVRALGGKTYGFYFPGNCSGCLAYTMMPSAAAAKTPVLSQDGTKARLDSPALTSLAELYRKMYAEGLVPSGAKSDDGTTWTTAFMAGQIGMVPIGTFAFPDLATKARFAWGVAPFTAPDGGANATFVGGDVIGVTRGSEHYAQAVDFLTWSVTDEPQLEVWAKDGHLTPRFDLAGNKYTQNNPARVAAVEGLRDGFTPSALPYGEIFNSQTGPWLQGLRGYIFNGDTAALTKAQQAVQATLDQAR